MVTVDHFNNKHKRLSNATESQVAQFQQNSLPFIKLDTQLNATDLV